MPFDLRRINKDGDIAGVDDLERFPGTQRFIELLDSLAETASEVDSPDRAAASTLFQWQEDVFVARAPGRLDVMGGIADYSGSLVLQMPLAEACHVAAQRHPAGDAAPQLRIVSMGHGDAFEVDLAQLLPGGEPVSYEAAQALFRRDPSKAWAAYVGGALVVLARERGARFDRGLSILVSSDVPEGKGVSSSAAVEVAAMAAVAAAHGIALDGRTLGLLCQRVENAVVGAPCGVMDQLTAALGQESRLLALRCQPAEVQGFAAIPPHVQFWGVDSGIVHSVGGSDYGQVRAGAFMGLRIASQLAHDDAQRRQGDSGSANGEVPPLGGGYLANLQPSEFALRYEERLPESMEGAAFLRQYGTHWDAATTVDPSQRYAVRTPAAHPVHENFRVHAFQQVMAGTNGEQQLGILGELMRQSHASYSRCGLGSDGTDRLVELVQEEHDAAVAAGREPAVFGAKITGGGCGGTVCMLALASPQGEKAVQRVVQRYSRERQYTPKVFRGSSPGAAAFGHLVLRRRQA